MPSFNLHKDIDFRSSNSLIASTLLIDAVHVIESMPGTQINLFDILAGIDGFDASSWGAINPAISSIATQLRWNTNNDDTWTNLDEFSGITQSWLVSGNDFTITTDADNGFVYVALDDSVISQDLISGADAIDVRLAVEITITDIEGTSIVARQQLDLLLKPEWDLPRGLNQMFSLTNRIPDHLTGHMLASETPTHFSIADGNIVSDLPHTYTDTLNNIVIMTDQDEDITLPVTVRDWFPSDRGDYHHFFALWRSWNGEADVDLFEVEIRGAESGIPLHSTVMVQSNADGYDDIETAVAGAPSSSIYCVTDIMNQVNADGNADGGGSFWGVVGYRDADGNDTFFRSPAGRLFMRSSWNLQDFVASWIDTGYDQSEYQTSAASGAWGGEWAMMVIAHRRVLDDAAIDLTDGNTYPGFFDQSNSHTYRFNTTNKPSDVSIGLANAGNWFAWMGSRTPASTSNALHSRIASLEVNAQNEQSRNSSSQHSASGRILMSFRGYDFSEFAIADIPNNADEANAFVQSERLNFFNNAVVEFQGETHQYTL